MNIDEFKIECNKLGINITNDNLEKLNLYKNLLQEWNNKFNLTTIIKDEDIYLKHFYDSLCLSKIIKLDTQSLCDFGTGAGFPGLVLAIIFSNLSVTLIESNNKKITFLDEVIKVLNLNNVELISDRIENYAKENREKFDIVTCRAVSNLNIILELSSQLVKINGYFIPMKSNVEEELVDCKDNISKLSYRLIKKEEYLLPKELSKRTILLFEKVSKTDDKYPRSYNIIVKNFKK